MVIILNNKLKKSMRETGVCISERIIVFLELLLTNKCNDPRRETEIDE